MGMLSYSFYIANAWVGGGVLFFDFKYIVVSFVVVLMIFATAAAFTIVDLGSGRYMPEQLGVMFQINFIDEGEISFTAMNDEYIVKADSFLTVKNHIAKTKALLPSGVRFAQGLAEIAANMVNQLER